MPPHKKRRCVMQRLFLCSLFPDQDRITDRKLIQDQTIRAITTVIGRFSLVNRFAIAITPNDFIRILNYFLFSFNVLRGILGSSSSIRIRWAGPSISSNCPLRMAQKMPMPATITMNAAKPSRNIRIEFMLFIFSHLPQTQRIQNNNQRTD